MESRQALDGPARVLLDPASSPADLLGATRELQTLFATITGMKDQPTTPEDSAVTRLDQGVAIAPVDAGRCLVDFARTTAFTRGVHNAVGDLAKRLDPGPVRILYAGCGPFATLVLPAMAVAEPGTLAVTLLDCHARSLESARVLIEHFDLGAHIAGYVQADAVTYRAPEAPHLVIVETMQRALEKEPQVAITQNLAPQLHMGGVFIPGRIRVSLCAADLAAEFKVAPASEVPEDPHRRRVELGTLVDLTPVDAADVTTEMERPRHMVVPDLAPGPRWQLLLRTEIDVYGDHRLGDYDSGITVCAVVHEAGVVSGGEAFEVRYRTGPEPGFEVRKGSATRLRPVEDSDLDTFFTHLQDPVAAVMAAFVAADRTDRDAFDAKWARIRGDSAITTRTILDSGKVAGHIASFVMEGQLEVTYWVDRALWGRGLATRALELFLAEMRERPLHARAAADNLGSIRVLEKCGFRRTGTDTGFAAARGGEIEEVLLRLDGEGAKPS